MANNFTVYCHISPSGKKYVGITCYKPEYRWADGKGYSLENQPSMYNAIQKYGWENFQHIILATNLSKEWAHKIEMCLIRDWKLQNHNYGYNISAGGELGRLGIPLPLEVRQKISRSHIGLRPSKESREKNRQKHLGRKDTEETRLKKSINGKGKKHRPMTDAEKEHLRNLWKGKSHGHATTNNRKWMTLGSTTLLVSPEDIQKYLNNGYRFGRQRQKED